MSGNLEPNISRYLHGKGRRLGLPISGTFELTARCNFSCPMCYVHLAGAEESRELTAEQWLDLAREARDAGMVFALLTGGEPFIRRDFFEIYQGMKDLGLMITINSNGSMLHGAIREKLLQDPPFRMNISLYGGCEETYRGMCGRDAYRQVLDNIRALKAAGVDVSLNVAVTPYNRQDLEKIFKDARELDVHVRMSSYMYPQVRVNGAQFGCVGRLTPRESAESQVRWEQLQYPEAEFQKRARGFREMSLEAAEGCPLEMGEGVTCRAGSTSFWMTWEGKMLPCGMFTGPSFDPFEMGFRNAWDRIREETGKIRLPAACGSCRYRQLCGVCAAVCLTETGSFTGVPEYLCQRVRHQEQIMDELSDEGAET